MDMRDCLQKHNQTNQKGKSKEQLALRVSAHIGLHGVGKYRLGKNERTVRDMSASVLFYRHREA